MDAIKDVTCVMRDNQLFPLCCYRTISQIRTVLQWFCVITLRAKKACAHLSYSVPFFYLVVVVIFLPTRARNGSEKY